ncbi:MAG TPA: hypothetical protein VLX90_06850, partial [Steroidobacteraceae bacterium]|nr:hypothetical protein [Steroidobacteraceae bacterium]
MDPKLLTSILIAALVVWGIYRRLRRTFGRQAVQAWRLWLRIGILTVLGVLFVTTSLARSTQALGALVAGIACGAALGYLGLRHTIFEVTPQGRFYTPHTYIGLVVTLLFLGRLLYRFIYLAYNAGMPGGANPDFFAAYQRSPLTLGIFGVLIGYYVLYYAGILM